MIGKTTESLIQFHRMIALALRDREKTCFCTGARMDIDRAPIGDDKTLGAERFQPDVIGAGRDRSLNASCQQPFEGGEQDMLQIYCERQKSVQESRNRRQLVLQSI